MRPAQHSHTFHVEPYASRRSARRCASPTPQVQRLAARESKIYVISLDIDTVRSRRRSGIPLKFLTDSARAHTYAVTTASVRWTSCVGHVWAAQPAPSSQKCAVGQLGRNALLLCTPADGSPSRAVHPHPPQEAPYASMASEGARPHCRWHSAVGLHAPVCVRGGSSCHDVDRPSPPAEKPVAKRRPILLRVRFCGQTSPPRPPRPLG